MASFSARAKAETARKAPKHPCCEKAKIFGMLLFSGKLSADAVTYATETRESADLLTSFLGEKFHIVPEEETIAGNRGKAERIVLTVRDPDAIARLFDGFGIGNDEVGDMFFLSAEDAVCRSLLCEDCERSFIAGAFLSCGFVYPPDKKYQAEFVMRDKELWHILEGLLCRRELPPKKVTRRDKRVLYLQGVEKVSDLLGMIGATSCYFDVLNAQALKETAEATVRTTNFEVANMKKTTDAAFEQIKAIESLRQSGRFDSLPAVLRQTAKNRLENPDCTLAALAEMENPPVSKSQISKRLQRIVDFEKDQQKV